MCMEKISRFIAMLLDVLFPREDVSLFCDTLSSSTLEKLVSYTIVPTVPDCVAFFSYTNPVIRNVIYAMKYHGHPRPPKLFGGIIAPLIVEEISDRRMFGTYHNPLFVPIPLHLKKQKERGYNQSERIAESILKSIEDPSCTLVTNALIRTRNTQSQAQHKDARLRFQNVRGAFSVSKKSSIQNKDVILVDDVTTTGATFLEARKTLFDAGARNVWCIAVAH